MAFSSLQSSSTMAVEHCWYGCAIGIWFLSGSSAVLVFEHQPPHVLFLL